MEKNEICFFHNIFQNLKRILYNWNIIEILSDYEILIFVFFNFPQQNYHKNSNRIRSISKFKTKDIYRKSHPRLEFSETFYMTEISKIIKKAFDFSLKIYKYIHN